VEPNKPLIANINHYLTALEQQKIIPNFWTSAEYLLKSKAVWVKHKGLFGFITIDGYWLLPPLGINNSSISVYAGWPDIKIDGSKFLDYQFIYNPKDFQSMVGSQWQTFRKNIRKFPKRSNGELIYKRLELEESVPEISALLYNWADCREVFDPPTFVRFILQGDNRKGLFFNNHLVGVNVWDENYYYINFRYCVDNGSPFLNEYMRYLFYTDDEIIQRNKLVNDGGSLDSESLYRFKMKLNPCQILRVYSLTIS